MNKNRDILNSFRKKVQEKNADSTYTNKFLYHSLMEQAKWLMKREIGSGRMYSNNSYFQTLGCQEVIEEDAVTCCPVKTNCKVYRTKNKLPEMWIDNNGPVIRTVTSVDGTTEFTLTTPTTWQNKRNDPYQRKSTAKYTFFADNYLWFPEHNPHYVNINGFYTEDISSKSCKKGEEKPCVRFLDQPFPLPQWLHAEMMAKALQQMFPTKQFLEDMEINKNPNRKN